MTKKSVEKENIQVDDNSVLYADKIISIGFGACVSRLILGVESAPNSYTPTQTLVMPTSSLLEAFASIEKNIYGDGKTKELLINGLDSIKEQLNSHS